LCWAVAQKPQIRSAEDRGARREQGRQKGGNVKTRLTKSDLTAEVLKRIRAREGCETVSKVVLAESFDEDSGCNWEISVIDAVDAADPLAVGPAVIDVYEEMASEFEMLTVH
jgi:hypothetical protein